MGVGNVSDKQIGIIGEKGILVCRASYRRSFLLNFGVRLPGQTGDNPNEKIDAAMLDQIRMGGYRVNRTAFSGLDRPAFYLSPQSARFKSLNTFGHNSF